MVGTDFQHHDMREIYAAASSVFSRNTGVNPKIAIVALEQPCAEGLVAGVA
jgi:hypothetical protein